MSRILTGILFVLLSAGVAFAVIGETGGFWGNGGFYLWTVRDTFQNPFGNEVVLYSVETPPNGPFGGSMIWGVATLYGI